MRLLFRMPVTTMQNVEATLTPRGTHFCPGVDGGVVFTGDIAGDFMAFDARTGKVLWHHDTGQPIGGGVISYAVNGKQYIAVASGMRSKIGWRVDSTPARIIVFASP
jgi:alcohol dehydrogenase (cytochrome c)